MYFNNNDGEYELDSYGRNKQSVIQECHLLYGRSIQESTWRYSERHPYRNFEYGPNNYNGYCANAERFPQEQRNAPYKMPYYPTHPGMPSREFESWPQPQFLPSNYPEPYPRPTVRRPGMASRFSDFPGTTGKYHCQRNNGPSSAGSKLSEVPERSRTLVPVGTTNCDTKPFRGAKNQYVSSLEQHAKNTLASQSMIKEEKFENTADKNTKLSDSTKYSTSKHDDLRSAKLEFGKTSVSNKTCMENRERKRYRKSPERVKREGSSSKSSRELSPKKNKGNVRERDKTKDSKLVTSSNDKLIDFKHDSNKSQKIISDTNPISDVRSTKDELTNVVEELECLLKEEPEQNLKVVSVKKILSPKKPKNKYDSKLKSSSKDSGYSKIHFSDKNNDFGLVFKNIQKASKLRVSPQKSKSGFNEKTNDTSSSIVEILSDEEVTSSIIDNRTCSPASSVKKDIQLNLLHFPITRCLPPNRSSTPLNKVTQNYSREQQDSTSNVSSLEDSLLIEESANVVDGTVAKSASKEAFTTFVTRNDSRKQLKSPIEREKVNSKLMEECDVAVSEDGISLSQQSSTNSEMQLDPLDFPNLNTQMSYLDCFKKWFDDPRTLDMDISQPSSLSSSPEVSKMICTGGNILSVSNISDAMEDADNVLEEVILEDSGESDRLLIDISNEEKVNTQTNEEPKVDCVSNEKAIVEILSDLKTTCNSTCNKDLESDLLSQGNVNSRAFYRSKSWSNLHLTRANVTVARKVLSLNDISLGTSVNWDLPTATATIPNVKFASLNTSNIDVSVKVAAIVERAEVEKAQAADNILSSRNKPLKHSAIVCVSKTKNVTKRKLEQHSEQAKKKNYYNKVYQGNNLKKRKIRILDSSDDENESPPVTPKNPKTCIKPKTENNSHTPSMCKPPRQYKAKAKKEVKTETKPYSPATTPKSTIRESLSLEQNAQNRNGPPPNTSPSITESNLTITDKDRYKKRFRDLFGETSDDEDLLLATRFDQRTAKTTEKTKKSEGPRRDVSSTKSKTCTTPSKDNDKLNVVKTNRAVLSGKELIPKKSSFLKNSNSGTQESKKSNSQESLKLIQKKLSKISSNRRKSDDIRSPNKHSQFTNQENVSKPSHLKALNRRKSTSDALQTSSNISLLIYRPTVNNLSDETEICEPLAVSGHSSIKPKYQIIKAKCKSSSSRRSSSDSRKALPKISSVNFHTHCSLLIHRASEVVILDEIELGDPLVISSPRGETAKRQIVENDCTDQAYICEKVDLKEDIQIVKNDSSTEDDVVEVVTPLTIIDLTTVDERDDERADEESEDTVQRTFDNQFMEAKKELLDVLEEDDNGTITMYRAEENLSVLKDVEAVSASITLDSALNNMISEDKNVPKEESIVDRCPNNTPTEPLIQNSTDTPSLSKCAVSLPPAQVPMKNGNVLEQIKDESVVDRCPNKTLTEPIKQKSTDTPSLSYCDASLLQSQVPMDNGDILEQIKEESIQRQESEVVSQEKLASPSNTNNSKSVMLQNNFGKVDHIIHSHETATHVHLSLSSTVADQIKEEPNECLVQSRTGYLDTSETTGQINEANDSQIRNIVVQHQVDISSSCDIREVEASIVNSVPQREVSKTMGNKITDNTQSEIPVAVLEPDIQTVSQDRVEQETISVQTVQASNNTLPSPQANLNSRITVSIPELSTQALTNRDSNFPLPGMSQRDDSQALRHVNPNLAIATNTSSLRSQQQKNCSPGIRILGPSLQNVPITTANFNLRQPLPFSATRRRIVEVIARHLYFSAYIHQARHMFIQVLNSSMLFKNDFKIEIEHHDSLRLSRLKLQSTHLYNELASLISRDEYNAEETSASLIFEELEANLAVKDMPKSDSKLRKYLLLWELMQYKVTEYDRFPILRNLYSHSVMVVQRAFRRTSPFTPEMHATLVGQIQEYNRLLGRTQPTNQGTFNRIQTTNSVNNAQLVRGNRVASSNLFSRSVNYNFTGGITPNRPVNSYSIARRGHRAQAGQRSQLRSVRAPKYNFQNSQAPMVQNSSTSQNVALPGGPNTATLGFTPRYTGNYSDPKERHIYAPFGGLPRNIPNQESNANTMNREQPVSNSDNIGIAPNVTLLPSNELRFNSSARINSLPSMVRAPVNIQQYSGNYRALTGLLSNSTRSPNVEYSNSGMPRSATTMSSGQPSVASLNSNCVATSSTNPLRNSSASTKSVSDQTVGDNTRNFLTNSASLLINSSAARQGNLRSNPPPGSSIENQQWNSNKLLADLLGGSKDVFARANDDRTLPVPGSSTEGASLRTSKQNHIRTDATRLTLNPPLETEPPRNDVTSPRQAETGATVSKETVFPETSSLSNQIMSLMNGSTVQNSQINRYSESNSAKPPSQKSASMITDRFSTVLDWPVPTLKESVVQKSLSAEVTITPFAQLNANNAVLGEFACTEQSNNSASTERRSDKRKASFKKPKLPLKKRKMGKNKGPIDNKKDVPNQIDFNESPKDGNPKVDQPFLTTSSRLEVPELLAKNQIESPMVNSNLSSVQACQYSKEDNIETIDLTWIDDMDAADLQDDMDFITVKPEPMDDNFGLFTEEHKESEEETTLTVVYHICECGNKAELCCVCGDAFYCGQECQLKDWETHKNVCHTINEKGA